MPRSVGYLRRIDQLWCRDWFWWRRFGHRAFFGPHNDWRPAVRRRFWRRRGHAVTADDGQNLTDHSGMQPGRLIDGGMADIRVGAHVDIAERATKAGPAPHVGVI